MRPNYGAAVLLLPFACDETLSVYDELGSNHCFDTFHYLYLQDRCYPLFLFRYEYSFYGFVEIHRAYKLLKLHSLAYATGISLSPMTDNDWSILAFAPMILLLVLLKLILILNILALVHVDAVSVLELGRVRLPTVEAIVELALVTWNLLVTITTAHDYE